MITALEPLLALGKYRWKILYGGRGSGKSWSICEALVFLSTLADIRILCVREVQNSIKDSSYQLLVDTVSRLGLEGDFRITNDSIENKRTGARFFFKGLHNNQALKSTEGVDICWVEEAQTVSEESWRVLIPTIRKTGSEIWVSMNPNLPGDPSTKRFVDSTPPGAFKIKLNYDQNPYFKGSPLEAEMEYMKRVDYTGYLHVWEGYPRTISDAQIFHNWSVEPFPDDLYKTAPRLFFGMDFGFARDPTAIVRCFILDHKLYVSDEFYGVGVELDELPQAIRSIPDASRWIIKADSARPETISYLANRCGFNISAAKKWQGSIEDGITYLKGFEKIVIHPRCKHMADEAALYSYKTDRRTEEVLPIVEDKNNHCWDALRYALDGYIVAPGLEAWAAMGREF